MVDTVESLINVFKVDVQQSLPYYSLLNDVMQGKQSCQHILFHISELLALLCFWSAAPEICTMMIFVRIFLGTDRSMIHLQLLQLLGIFF